MINDKYRSALMDKFTDFSPVRSRLLSSEDTTRFYRMFRETFPICHLVFATACSSQYFAIEHEWTHEDGGNFATVTGEHYKERRILELFNDLVRAKNRQFLAHYAIVETLGYWYKGIPQPQLKSARSALHANIRTAWSRLESMQDKGVPTFNERLLCIPFMHACFDNFNYLLSMKYPREGKTSINEIGTAMLVREDTPFQLPPRTFMSSPLGIPFIVLSCQPHGRSRMLVMGCVVDVAERMSADNQQADQKIAQEQFRILKGFLYPEIGWDVISAPGMFEMPAITYRDQKVPPPMNACINPGTSNAALLFGVPRPFCHLHANTGAESFSSDRMFSVICEAQLLVDMRSNAYHLKELHKDAAVSLSGNSPHLLQFANFVTNHLMKDSSPTNKFLKFTEEYSMEIDAASKFQTDLVSHLHPHVGGATRIFAFPIIPYDETSYNGMKQVYYKIGQLLRMFEVEMENRRCVKLPNAEFRGVHFCTDQLTFKNWRAVKMEVIKKLTELNTAKFILPLLEMHSRFTCTHDFFMNIGFMDRTPFGDLIMALFCNRSKFI